MATITVNLKRGQTIFENIEEYPLPKKPHVKDYVFYFVPKTHGYGLGASTFFHKFYPNHIENFIAKSERSLEKIIEVLHTEIQQNTINQIREIVIVCHANERELLFPVTRHALDNAENKSKYQIIRPGTLVNLQEAFKADDPELKSFKEKRKEVIGKLKETSRVTFRACNFGSSREGLFALFSFFGGRANVYAPIDYQFFLDELGVGINSRLKSDLDFYKHLVKQGFISRKTKHSESRRVKVIKKLIEPGRGRHRFELSGYTIRNSRIVNGDKEEQDSFISAFNQEKVPDNVKERFLQQELSLSGEEYIQIKNKDEKWVLFDDLLKIKDHNNKVHTYKIEYTIQVEHDHFVDDDNHQASLFVYPVLNHRKSLPTIPIQLFFNDSQNDDFKGQLFELTSYSTIPEHGVDSNAKASFDAYEKLLDEGTIQDNEEPNIWAAFEGEGYSLTSPKIRKLPPKRQKKRWELSDEIKVIIKEEVENLPPDDQIISLKIEYNDEVKEIAEYGIIDDHITTVEEKKDYDAFVKLLDDGKIKDQTGHNLIMAILGDAAITNFKVKHSPPVEGKKRWELQCAIVYEIKETIDYIYPEGFYIALEVFQPVTRAKRLNFYESQGNDPDTPGTELMAYFDNLSLEELYDLVHFLREPYKEEHAFYIYKAQEAMKRKSEFMLWPVKKEEDEKRKNDPIYIYPSWAMLTDVEREDKDKYAYHFENVWREAKASTSRNIEFDLDLFEERKLPFPPVTIGKVVEPDTPENEVEILEQDPNNPGTTPDPPSKYFDKEMVYQVVKHEDLSCQKFKEVLEVINQNKGKSWEEIEKIFKETPVNWGDAGTLYDYLKADYGFNSVSLAFNLLDFFGPYASRSGVVGGLGVLANSRWIFAGSVALAIAGPVLMLKDILNAISEGKENKKREGIVTGLKQGNSMIIKILFDYNYHGIPIADSYDLFSNAPSHTDALKKFRRTTRVLLILSEFFEAHQKGYKIGLKEVENALNEDLKNYKYIFKKYVIDKGLKECHAKVLLNSGLIDENMIKRVILQGLHNQISKLAKYELVKTE